MQAGLIQCRTTLLEGDRDLLNLAQEPAEHRHIKGLGSDENIQLLFPRDHMDQEWVRGAGMVGNENHWAGRQVAVPVDIKA